jgi:hypothetical protein
VLKQTGNVDKMVVYFDLPQNYTVDGRSIKQVKIKIREYEKWHVMVVLCKVPVAINNHLILFSVPS